MLLHVRMRVGHAGCSTVGRRLGRCPSPRTHVVHAGHGCLRIGCHAVHVVSRRWLVARILALRLLLHARMWRPMTRVSTGRRSHRPWRRLWWSAACSIVSKVRVVSVEHVWCIAVHLNWGWVRVSWVLVRGSQRWEYSPCSKDGSMLSRVCFTVQ